ncbi:MAG: polysaccharide deacetylase family sporulation protein PdaB [Acetobacteraceae bacterium]|nr:polysaccharide deacetylase family sporulation protein PdaB [Acetobacteraceae bacterium]
MLFVTVSRKAKRWLLAGLSLAALLVLVHYGVRLGPGLLVAGKLHPIRSVNTKLNQAALTFDISWGEKVLPPVLEVLKKYGVRSTFFISGPWAAAHPDLARAIVAAGHELGSHGHHHLNYSQYPKEVIQENLRQAHQIIRDVTGVDCNLFRPPNGDYDDLVISTALELGYATIIWDTDSLDWKNPGVKFMVDRVTKKAHPGDIILMHASDSAQQTPEALPAIIEGLRKEGLELVPVSQLLRSAVE